MRKFLKDFLKRDRVILILILLFALFLRLIFLNKFPIGMTHDELNNIFSAKSFFYTFSFPPGTAPALLPTSMSYFTIVVPEVPVILLAPIIGILKMSLFDGRVAGAFLSILSVLFTYLIALHISKKTSYAQISALLMAINPWSFLMGRTMTELNFFVVFFLSGFYVLIKTKGWKIYWAVPLYLLGFFSYTGGQVSFLAFILLTLVFHYFDINQSNKKNLLKYFIFGGFFILVFAGYLFRVTHNQSFAARSGELYLPNSPVISQEVNHERELSVPSPFNSLFINKATVYTRGFISKYLDTFSVDNLFISGETRAVFSYQTHGTFYLIDFIFIISGIAWLYSFNKKGWMLFLWILIGCSITSGLSVIESSYSQRVGLIYPFLIMLSAFGISSIIEIFKEKKRIFISVLIGILYLISFINLMFIYFFRFPVYASDGWFFQDRLLSAYVDKTTSLDPSVNINIYTSEPKIIFEEYLFFTNTYKLKNAKDINNKLNRKDYSIGNIVFTDSCPKIIGDNSIIITDPSFQCLSLKKLKNPLRIQRLKDVLESYLIYGDKLCKNIDLGRYDPQSAFLNFSAESENSRDFCTNWITKL